MRKLFSSPTLAGSVIVVLLCACEGLSPVAGPGLEPPTDQPQIQASGSVWGYVVESSGICLTNATVEIISGPGTGRQTEQTVPCNAWDYGNGFIFTNLPLGATVTLRAKRPGYKPQDREVVVRNAGYADLFELLPE